MVTVAGVYQNGYVKLEQDIPSKNPMKVIVTFLEEIPEQPDKILSLSDFSWSKSQKLLEDFKGSFGDTVIEERRGEL